MSERNWQPIETLTKEYCSVLFFNEEWEGTEGAIQIGWLTDEGEYFVRDLGDFEPTHWMPLPAPPPTEPKRKA